jgi:23S rRNA (guanosine2251-2'-O)-methyltransferase
MKLDQVFGIHAVTTLLNRDPERVKRLFIVQGRVDPKVEKILALAAQAGVHVETYIVIFNYPSPIAVKDSLRKD